MKITLAARVADAPAPHSGNFGRYEKKDTKEPKKRTPGIRPGRAIWRLLAVSTGSAETLDIHSTNPVVKSGCRC